MGDGKVAVGFNPVPDCVAQIQLLSGSGVKFVFHDHVALEFHAAGDNAFPVEVKAGLSQAAEQSIIIQDTIFDDLGAAVPVDVFR